MATVVTACQCLPCPMTLKELVITVCHCIKIHQTDTTESQPARREWSFTPQKGTGSQILSLDFSEMASEGGCKGQCNEIQGWLL